MRHPIIRFSTLAIGSVALCIGLRFGYYSLTDGFALRRIENTIPPTEALVQPAPSQQLLPILQKLTSKPFRYLKKGSQSYAFISEDNEYILKLYKCHHLLPADWLYEIPMPEMLLPWRNRLVERRAYKLQLTVSSFTIAGTILKNECAIIYSQVVPNNSYTLYTTIIDRIGREYRINLAEYGFAFQKKASLVFPSLAHWIETGDILSAKKALFSLIGLMAERSKKGIQDSDPDLHKNAGFIGTEALFIDIGSFHKNPKIREPNEMKRDLIKTSTQLLLWLEKKSPELYEYTNKLLENPSEISWHSSW